MSKGYAYIFAYALSLTTFGCDNAIERLEDDLAAASKPVEAPMLLTATPGDNSIKLTWSKVEEADNYIVHWREGDGNDQGKISIQGEDFEHLSIKNYVTYHYTVSANARNLTSPQSNSLSAMPLAGIMQISTGSTDTSGVGYHTCAIRLDGTLWCWGSNSYGQLGTGTLIDSALPVQESSKTKNWATLDTGRANTCATKLDGSLYCWGLWDFDPNEPLRLSPSRIDNANDWISVSVSSHVCATKSDYSLYCWGRNFWGQLGIDPTLYGEPGNLSRRLTPTQEALAATDWDSVSVGWVHTCALRKIQNGEGKTLWCWGNNSGKELGVTTPSFIQAIPIQVGTDSNWISVSAASNSTCGLKSDKTIECWGSNSFGESGQNPSIERVDSPTTISGSNWKTLKSDDQRSCAQDESNYIFCWGRDTNTQLGSYSIGNSHVPVQVGSPTDNNWLHFSVGRSLSCGIRRDHQLFCWGSNSTGQIGNGSFAYKTRPTEISHNDSPWLHLVIGASHNCAIQKVTPTTGSLWCWGWNEYGTLGIGNNIGKSVPTPLNQGNNWSQVSSGSRFQCAQKTVSSNGQVFCWGGTSSGQLGTGQSSTEQLTPMQEATIANDWKQINSGSRHTCAIKFDRTLWCWGANSQGQLGDGSIIQKPIPTLQSGDSNWVLFSAGNSHSCGLKSEPAGTSLWCWGNDSNGQIGNGPSNLGTSVLSPSQEEGLNTDWLLVDAGYNSSCAIKNNGTLWCWGRGTSIDSDSPFQMGTEEDWQSISVGEQHYCAIKFDNSLWCWGLNPHGQLGNGTLVDKSFSNITEETTKSKDWAEVHAEKSHTCGLKLNGRILCWGAGNNGVIGDGSAWYNDPQLVSFP